MQDKSVRLLKTPASLNVSCFIFSNRIYMCEDLAQFVYAVIDKMETLDPWKLLSTLTAFFQRFEMFYCSIRIRE